MLERVFLDKQVLDGMFLIFLFKYKYLESMLNLETLGSVWINHSKGERVILKVFTCFMLKDFVSKYLKNLEILISKYRM